MCVFCLPLCHFSYTGRIAYNLIFEDKVVSLSALHLDSCLSAIASSYPDCRFYSLYYGIPTTSYGPEAKNIHGIDESVCLKSMAHYTAAYAAFITNWCGVQKL